MKIKVVNMMKKNAKLTLLIILILVLLSASVSCNAQKEQGSKAPSSPAESAQASLQPSAATEPIATGSPKLGLPSDELPDEAGKITEIPLTEDMEDGDYA